LLYFYESKCERRKIIVQVKGGGTGSVFTIASETLYRAWVHINFVGCGGAVLFLEVGAPY